MIEIKISFDEIVKLIEDKYNIKNIRFMRKGTCEPDYELCELPDYVIGDNNK